MPTADDVADALKRVETLELRVSNVETQLGRITAVLRQLAERLKKH